MLESLTEKSCMQEYLHKHFWSECHKGFLIEASVTCIEKTDRKDPKKKTKILDANIEKNEELWS